jgi:hypothetical protein
VREIREGGGGGCGEGRRACLVCCSRALKATGGDENVDSGAF